MAALTMKFPAIAIVAIATVLIQLHVHYLSRASLPSDRIDFYCTMQLQRAARGFGEALNFSAAFASDGEDAHLVHRIFSCIKRMDTTVGDCQLQGVSWSTFGTAVMAAEVDHLRHSPFLYAETSRTQLIHRVHNVFRRLHARDSTFSQEFDVCLPKTVDAIHVDDSISAAASFVNNLARLITRHHVTKDRNVVVVGGGPVGLLTAIEALAARANVTLIEKRLQYERPVWFDITNASAVSIGSPLLRLKRLGFDIVHVPHITHEEYSADVIITVQCRVIERFLLRTALMLGLHPVFNATVTGLQCGGHPCEAAAVTGDASVDTSSPAVVRTDGASSYAADVVVTAVGKQSLPQRAGFSVPARHQTRVNLGNSVVVLVPGLHQVTLLGVLASNATGQCPGLQRDASGDVIDPFLPSFRIRGVTTVFKRFFQGHCELQVLVDNELGQRLARSNHGAQAVSTQNTQAWALLHDVCNIILTTKCNDLACTQALFTRNDSGDVKAQLVNVTIHRADLSVAWLTHTSNGESHRSGVLMVLGDANVNAFYRLGIGINTALISVGKVAKFLLEEVTLVDVRSDLDAIAARMVDIEVEAVYREAYCGHVVGPDGAVFQRSHGEFVEIPPLQAAQPCHSE